MFYKIKQSKKYNISLIDYLKQAFSTEGIKENIIENDQEEYEKSVELKEKLEQTPIEKVLQMNQEEATQEENTREENKLEENAQEENAQTENTQEENTTQAFQPTYTQTTEKYITAYDSETKEYVVYKESELLDLEKEDYESETTKISQNAQLTEFYYTANKEKAKSANGLIWIVPTVMDIGASLAILIKRNKK